MATVISADTPLHTLDGDTAPLESWTTTFHLALVVLDPFELESAWILDTAVRVLSTFAEADCRVAFLLTCSDEQARQFLGPLAEQFLVFCDPNRSAVKGLDLSYLPAFVHLNVNNEVDAKAEGWQPEDWRSVSEELAIAMRWHRPEIPLPEDPIPFAGTPATG